MRADETPIGTIRKLADGSFEGTLERVYEGHSRSEVWRMLTEPASMGQWLAPGTIEPRQGGRVKIDFEDSGTKIESSVIEIEPDRVLSYSWSSGEEPQRPLHWSLDEISCATKLTLTVRIPPNEDAARACAGFEGHLEMLGAALEGVPMKFPFELFLQARKEYTRQLGA